MSVQTMEEWPEHIQMSGLPFMLQGWNNIYYKSEEMRNGFPVYCLDSYTLYYTIPIIGVKVFYNCDKWVLQRNGDLWTTDIECLEKPNQLFGKWSYGALVKKL